MENLNESLFEHISTHAKAFYTSASAVNRTNKKSHGIKIF